MKSLSVVFLLLVIFLTGVHADAQTNDQPLYTSASSLTKVILQLNWKYQFEYAGYIAAKEKGYYHDAGLDVELKELESGINPISEVLDGRANYGIWISSLILERLRGKPLVMLTNDFKHSPLILMTSPDIRSPLQLKGKKIMGTAGEMDMIEILFMLQRYGLQPDKDIIGDAPLGFAEIKKQPIIWHQMNALKPYTIGVVDGYVNTEMLDRWIAEGRISSVKAADDITNLKNLIHGKVQAAVIDPYVMQYCIQKDDELQQYKDNLSFNDVLLDFKGLFICFTKNSRGQKLAADFNTGLTQINHIALSEDYFAVYQPSLPFIRFKQPENYQLSSSQYLDSKPSDSIQSKDIIHLTDQELMYLKQHPIACVAVIEDWEPFTFMDNGNLTGFSVDLIRLIENKIGISLKLIPGSWSHNLNKFKDGNIEIIDSISYKPERVSFTNYTQPYYEIPTVIFARHDFGIYNGLESLKGKRVGTTKDVFFLPELKKLGGIEIIEYKNNEAQIRALAFGKLDVVINNYNNCNLIIAKNAYTGLVVLDELRLEDVGKEDLRLGVRKDLPILYEIVQKGLNAITQKEWMNLKRKWFGSQEMVSKNAKITLTEMEKAWLQKHPRIKVSNEMDYPPFDFAIGGQPQGYSIDMLNILAQKIGINIDYINGYSWTQLVDMFKKSEIDLLHTLSHTPEREKFGIFTKSYRRNKSYFITRKETQDITDFTELYDKIMAVGKGWSQEEFVSIKHPQIRLLAVSNAETMLELVHKGDAYASVNNDGVARYLIKTKGYDLKLAGWAKEYDESMGSSGFHFLAQKNAPELVSMLNKAITSLTPGDINVLENKWLGAIDTKKDDDIRVQLTPEEQAYLLQKGQIKMSVDPDWMPYERINKQGKHEGIAADFIKLISDRSGVKIDLLKTKTWSESIESSQKGMCDMLSFLNQTSERDKWLFFTEPMYVVPRAFITHEEHPFILNPRNIKNETIALPKGYSTVEIVKKNYPNLKIILVEIELEALKAVSNKKADMTLSSLDAVAYTIKKEGLFNLKVAGQATDIPDRYMIGVIKREPMLVKILNKAIRTLTSEEQSAIINKYISVSINRGVDYRLIWKILGIVALLFIAVCFWMRRMSVMNRKIKLANQKAEAATKAKSEFLANMSHEIRTPMNAIIGLSGLALKIESTPKHQDYLKKIESSALSLLGIINDILDFSKIEAGKMDMESIEFNLEDILNNISNLISIKAEEKGIELLFNIKKEVLFELIGDPLRLGQVLINLANNAVKFTEAGQIIIMIERAAYLETKASDRVCLKFSIKDSGIGMTKEQIEKLFQAFSQADGSTTRKFGGTGLGLSISKRLVEMMNGKIWAESEVGKGTTFIFTAYFGLQQKKTHKVYLCPENIKNIRVLVVDDNPAAREILCDAIKSFGFGAYQVASGHEAIAEIEKAYLSGTPYNLVLMDWKMPIMDGIETSKRIKSNPNLSHIPAILMVTAYGREEIRKQAEEAGIEYFLTKPVNHSFLFDGIMSVCGHYVSDNSVFLKEKTEEIKGLEFIRGTRILLVEDNVINQQVASELLEGEGFEVIVAENGKVALTSLNTNERFDAILMDIQMPEMDGFETTKRIREDARFKDIPIIAMTAHAMAEERKKCLDAGMNDHVSKPINPKSLFSTLVKWIPPQEQPLLLNKPKKVEQGG
ncbi:MAG: transporter substrate-binding domain-containing protein [Desulfobacterales bacterium]|nr:transporter substrate-binding domain-containing protein [Desulfobacterales bacterium]